jgi:hypothetical protein
MNLMKYFRKFLAITAVITLTSCVSVVTQKKTLNCPEPVQGCEPIHWSGIDTDTTEESAKYRGYYYKFSQVRQINSPADEWQLSFFEKKKASFMFTDRDKQRLMIARMVTPDRFTVESGLSVPFDGHYGSLSTDGAKAVLSAVKESHSDGETINGSDGSSFNSEVEMPADGIIGQSRIYLADFVDKQLKNVRDIGGVINSDIYGWQSQPVMLPGGDGIIYASDRDGSISGTDLWLSLDLGGGRWSEPVNLGDSINTRCDELTPFISADKKTLMFSSSGHENVGGYDIFEANISKEFWDDIKKKNLQNLTTRKNYFTQAKNLRPPLNTEFDELFPSGPGDLDSIMYYSSNQSSGTGYLIQMKGGFDLYVRQKIVKADVIATKKRTDGKVDINIGDEPVIVSDIKMPEIKLPGKYTLEGTVYDERDRLPVKDAEVTVREIPIDTIYKQTNTDDQGKYKVELEKDREFEVSAQGKDLFFDSFKMRVEADDTMKTVKKDLFLPEKFELRVNFPLDDYSNPYRFTIDSLGLETNKTWQSEMDLLATNIIRSRDRLVKVILVGNTDYFGSDDYNMKLGKRRVEFVIAELIRRGVPQEILEGRSAGENELLAKLPGEDDSIFRKRLRRVTIEKVLNN